MKIIFVFTLSIVSSFLFDFLKITPTSIKLMVSYKQIYFLLKKTNLTDNEKQRELIKASITQVKQLTILITKMILVVSPIFLILAFNINLIILVSFQMILISGVGILAYVVIKKIYEKTFKHR